MTEAEPSEQLAAKLAELARQVKDLRAEVAGARQEADRVRLRVDERTSSLHGAFERFAADLEGRVSELSRWRSKLQKDLDRAMPQLESQLKHHQSELGALTEDQRRRTVRSSARNQLVVGLIVAALAVAVIVLYVTR